MGSGSVGHQNERQGKKVGNTNRQKRASSLSAGTATRNYLQLIRQFILIIHQFNQTKKYATFNPYRRLASKIELPFSDEKKSQYYLNLFDSLVHELTLFNHVYRVERKGRTLESSKEDVVLALELLSPLVFPSSLLSAKTLIIYELLEDHFDERVFTVSELSRKLRKSKSTVKRHLKLLEGANYVQRTGGNKKRGYEYQINHYAKK